MRILHVLLALTALALACGAPTQAAPRVAIDVYPIGAAPVLALADLDGDGRADLVASFGAGAPDGGVIVRRGTSQGLGPPTRALVGAVTFALADVDGDGRADLVVHDRQNLGVLSGGAGEMRVAWRVRGGRLLAATATDVLTVEDDGAIAVRAWSAEAAARVDTAPLVPRVVADADGDGTPDVFGAALGAIGARASVAAAPIRLLDAPALGAVVAADVDGDGAAEALAWGDGALVIAGHLGRLASLRVARGLAAVGVADLDGDRRRDLALVAPRSLVVACAALDYAPCVEARGPWVDPTSVDAGDLDGDGRPELVVADRASGAAFVVRLDER